LRVAALGIFSAVIEFPLNSSVTTLHDLFHSTGFVVARNVAILFAVVFWLGLALWVNRDARRRIGDPILVFFATLLGLAPPYIGPVVYLLFRPAETLDDVRSRRVELEALEQHLARSQQACPVCRSWIEPDYIACPVCATMLRQPCATCNAPVEPLWQVCPYCASAIAPSAVDLDAALTAEAKMITLVDDIPLVPQPPTRAADA
jgi:RNA polymerase subunit RPABC4/transcription elongation factor Spt4